MISNPFKFRSFKFGGVSVLVALTLSLASCANMHDPAGVGVLVDDPFETRWMKLVVKRQGDSEPIPVDEAMWDQAQLEKTLEIYGVQKPHGKLIAWINKIENANGGEGPTLFAGPGGIQGRSLLHIAKNTLNQNGDFEERPGAKIWGQIEEEVNGEPGFKYNKMDKSGHLWVTMFTKTTKGGSGKDIVFAERYKVVVAAGGYYKLEPKNLADPANVFPVAEGVTEIKIDKITASGFDYKLYASGTTIQVEEIWRNKDYEADPDDFKKVNKNAAKYKNLFLTDSESCIDMMLANNMVEDYQGMKVPMETLPAGAKPPFYCLGRCKNPPIINTR